MSNSSIEKINNIYNFKIEYKLINNKELLKSRLSEIPKSSGCYIFKDIDNNLLYIGKSKKLRSRVSSYFNNFAIVWSALLASHLLFVIIKKPKDTSKQST